MPVSLLFLDLQLRKSWREKMRQKYDGEIVRQNLFSAIAPFGDYWEYTFSPKAIPC